MVHTSQKLEDFKFNSLEIKQHLGSLKYVINIIMWIRDMECYTILMPKSSTHIMCAQESSLHT
jgi:hypothetical protein